MNTHFYLSPPWPWLCLVVSLLAIVPAYAQSPEPPPVRVGVVGLVHTHVHWILGREDDGAIEIVGIVEPNRELAQEYSQMHGYSMDLVYPDLESMLAATQPEAVTAFGTIYDHLSVVQTCAPLGIHVMVEKPLAVSWEHAQEMAALARKHEILLLTNYETTWYASNHHAKAMVESGHLGPVRKVVVHSGHQGPKEIGVNSEFLDWLVDPKWNGGGALTDFGCYGANLMTWLMDGQAPSSVMAITQSIKPEVYPLVEDQATILLTYPEAQAIIQASWNWPYSRKDMEVYGKGGAVVAKEWNQFSNHQDDQRWVAEELEPLATPYHDPFSFLAAMVRGQIDYDPKGLSSLENNLVVMKILEAAKQSAATGKQVSLDNR